MNVISVLVSAGASVKTARAAFAAAEDDPFLHALLHRIARRANPVETLLAALVEKSLAHSSLLTELSNVAASVSPAQPIMIVLDGDQPGGPNNDS